MQPCVSSRERKDFEFNLAIGNEKQYMVLATTFLYNVDCNLNYRCI